MQTITCFLLEPADQGEARLRRYSMSQCPATGLGYHNVILTLGRHPWDPTKEDLWGHPYGASVDDSRWPQRCSCGYTFQPEDPRQAQTDRLFRRSDTGELLVLRDAPPGAMWFADFYPDRGPDGHALVVMTPGGEWLVDGPASNGPGTWQRSGSPPLVTAQPSIHFPGRYHGFLTNGQLVEC